MSQKVQFVASILHNPKMIILDEPFSGLDPLSQDILKESYEILHREGQRHCCRVTR
jgi:ABC-2 type transport system ATP-binding protein